VIRYALSCEHGHAFESWFRDAAAYDEQVAAGFLACPACGSERVEKAIMAPHVAQKADRDRPAARAAAEERPVSLVSPEDAELRAKVKALREHLTANADYVGPGFAEEARRIHYGEIEERGIRGQASREAADSLREEGIEVFSLPVPPALKGPIQ
jgi:hypothetical protein